MKMQVCGNNFVEATFQVFHLKFIGTAEGLPIDLLACKTNWEKFLVYKAYCGCTHFIESSLNFNWFLAPTSINDFLVVIFH